jgi:SAM-dependent methyltransferase
LLYSARYQKETREYISYLKQNASYYIDPKDKLKLNRLACIEDWENHEVIETILELYNRSPPHFIHRKQWEWVLGIIAIRRFGKLNKNSTALGVGSGKENVLFYLANKVNHVYATDLYRGHWAESPSDFPENPKKYAPFPYNEDALTVLRMDGTKLEFPSESFDIAFSFSSIEGFGGKNHSGALRSLREIERVLKPGGIAVIATEYIINNKEHNEFFNRRTIYSDLINKLEKLQLVEPLDLRITSKTLDTVMEFYSSLLWEDKDEQYKKTHSHILLRIRNILYTSIMLVFQR